MRRYETICIIDPDLSADERVPIYERLHDLVPQQGGFVVEQDDWGNQKLAYEINKKPRGYYVRLDYCGTGAVVDEMERFFRIDDRVLKYMTVLLDKDADVEGIKAEMAAAAKAQAQKEQAEQAAAAEAAAKAAAAETPATEAPGAPATPEASTTTTDNEKEE
jgi:small subunit ribosomal protein S6